ncbi:MAG: tetratricopeptide repeat protein [Verrucomicrobia bacterium]|nr:tetratricopeptide repeat protein [Verrucomicrobiota bacterium]
MLIRPFILAALAVLLAIGCTTPAAKPSSPAGKTPAATKPARTNIFDLNPLSGPRPPASPRLNFEQQEQRAEAMARYSAGLSHQMQGDVANAVAQYYFSALADPANEPLVALVASQLIQGKAYDKALELLDKAVKLPAASGMLHTLRGVAHAQAGRTNTAIVAYFQAIERLPAQLQAYQNLAQLFAQQNRRIEALLVLDQAASAAPAEADYLLDLAEIYASLARSQSNDLAQIRPRIVRTLDRAAPLAAPTPQQLQRLSDGYQFAGETKKAAEQFAKLLPLVAKDSPVHELLRQRLTDLYLRADDRERAAEMLRAMVKDNPTDARAHFILGLVAHESKQLDEAARHLETAIRLDPKFEAAYHELAGVRLTQKQGPQALELLAKAKEKFPRSFLIEYYSAVACNGMKDYPGALKHFTAAELLARTGETNRLNEGFYFQLGAVHERNKDFKQAENYFRQALKLAPDFADALNYLGYMWAERGENLIEAREMIEKAVKLEPDNGAFLDSLGWVLHQLGKPREALPWLQKSIAKTKEADATLYDHLGDVLAALKRFKEAREAWQKSLAVEPSPEIQKKLDAAPRP